MNFIDRWKWVSRASQNVKAFGFDINAIYVRKEGIEIVVMIPITCEKAGKCWRPESRLYTWATRSTR